jgi:hypothetical protein
MKYGCTQYVYHLVVHLSSFCVFAEYGTAESMTSSPLLRLFLILAALILVPAMVWVCCQWKQCCRRNHPPPHSRHDTGIIIETGYHINNPVYKQQRSNESGLNYTPVSTKGYCCSNECQSNCSHTVYV